MLVDDRICLGDLLFVRTAATLEKRLFVLLLNGVEKVITLLTELHGDVFLFDVYRFLLNPETHIRAFKTNGSRESCLGVGIQDAHQIGPLSEW